MSRQTFCEACQWLRENAADFVVNGVNEQICNHLAEDRGIDLNNTARQQNATDLQTLIDCLIGMHKDQLRGVDLCAIKDWLDRMMKNLWLLKTAWACNERGQWNNIWDIRNELNSQNNRITNMERTLNEILQHFHSLGAWDFNGTPSQSTTISGSWQGDRRPAVGNINLFGTPDEGNRFIRTNNIAGNANDIRGGL